MKLTDIIALAKAGYKKTDIDELLEVPVDEPEKVAIPESKDEENIPKGGDEEYPEESADVPDYEKLYKDVLEQIETLKNDLKIAQTKNINQNISTNNNDDLADLADVFRSYM